MQPYRQAALKALEKESRCKQRMLNTTSNTLHGIHKNAAERARIQALDNLLAMHCVTHAMDINNHHPILNKERAALYQAISSELPLKYIEMMLDDYPRACKSGGLGDSIHHPIHAACIYNQIVVEPILKLYPDSADQPDEGGRMPFELFLEHKEIIGVSCREFKASANLFMSLNQMACERVLSKRQKRFKREVSMVNKDCIVSSGTTDYSTANLDSQVAAPPYHEAVIFFLYVLYSFYFVLDLGSSRTPVL